MLQSGVQGYDVLMGSLESYFRRFLNISKEELSFWFDPIFKSFDFKNKEYLTYSGDWKSFFI